MCVVTNVWMLPLYLKSAYAIGIHAQEGQAAPAQANVTWCFQEASNIDISGISIIADGSGEDNAEPCNETPSLIAIGECQTPVQFTFNLVKVGEP